MSRVMIHLCRFDVKMTKNSQKQRDHLVISCFVDLRGRASEVQSSQTGVIWQLELIDRQAKAMIIERTRPLT